MFADTVKNTGSAVVQFFDADDNLLHTVEEDNLVVTAGLNWIASRTTGAPALMGWMAMGTDGTAPAPGHAHLGHETARVALTSAVTTGSVTAYTATFPAGVGTGTLAELGIFNASNLNGGVMLNRVAFPSEQKESTTIVKVVWNVTQS
jgi:hypothetical protein